MFRVPREHPEIQRLEGRYKKCVGRGAECLRRPDAGLGGGRAPAGAPLGLGSCDASSPAAPESRLSRPWIVHAPAHPGAARAA